jgi:hypothetical protein
MSAKRTPKLVSVLVAAVNRSGSSQCCWRLLTQSPFFTGLGLRDSFLLARGFAASVLYSHWMIVRGPRLEEFFAPGIEADIRRILPGLRAASGGRWLLKICWN